MPNNQENKVEVSSKTTSSTEMQTQVKVNNSDNKDVSVGPYLKFKNDLNGNVGQPEVGFSFSFRW